MFIMISVFIRFQLVNYPYVYLMMIKSDVLYAVEHQRLISWIRSSGTPYMAAVDATPNRNE